MNNKRIKKIVCVTCIFILGGFVPTAFASHDFQHVNEEAADYIADKLSLDQEQEDRLEILLIKTSKKRRELLESAQQKIHHILTQDTISKDDAIEIMLLRRKQTEAMRNYIAARLVEFHANLTAEQRKDLAELAPLVFRYFQGNGKKYQKRYWN
ncbi:MAG: hypothetical protein ACNYPH_05710 [Gammaproteobacteria bacterium WSBS_2016_MAG_OTU1]